MMRKLGFRARPLAFCCGLRQSVCQIAFSNKRNHASRLVWRLLAHRVMQRSTAEHELLRSEAPSAESREGRLDSWKEIATYLGRGVRTVQRWEREEGLPVHRLGHEKRGSVYARREELAAWWESRRQSLGAGAVAAPKANEAPVQPQLRRVTRTSAATFWPALSSDGRMVAYVSDGGQDGTIPQIWLQQIDGAAVRLTSGLRACRDLSFGPGDTRILFTAEGDAGQNVYEMPTLGGDPRVLRRGAKQARISPDGRWLSYVSLDPAGLLRITALDEPGVHKVAPALVDVSYPVWSPDSAHVVVQAHPDPMFEPELWVVPVNGGPLVNTGIMQRFRQRGFFLLTSPPAWVGDSLLFSVITSEGINVWRQQLTPVSFQPLGDPERMTRGTDLDCLPTVACGRMAYVSTHPDQNLWSTAVDVATGVTHGPLRRMTRGPGILGHLSVTSDGRTLSYWAARNATGRLVLRDLEHDTETAYAGEPANGDKGFPTLSPSGSQLAFGVRMLGPLAMRPIYVANLSADTSRKLGDDCGGRPRQWMDERVLLIETFGSRFNTLFLLDTADGSRRAFVAAAERSVTNPRLSFDRRWIAFDAATPGGPPSVFVAPVGVAVDGPIPESAWVLVDRSASHPFWSVDGRLLYYLPTTPSPEIRGVVRARRFSVDSGQPEGESFVAFSSNEMVVPAQVTGTAPIATADQIIFVLGDFRGDIWMMDLDGAPV
jgi:Tol biopolymer transport system component